MSRWPQACRPLRAYAGAFDDLSDVSALVKAVDRFDPDLGLLSRRFRANDPRRAQAPLPRRGRRSTCRAVCRNGAEVQTAETELSDQTHRSPDGRRDRRASIVEVEQNLEALDAIAVRRADSSQTRRSLERIPTNQRPSTTRPGPTTIATRLSTRPPAWPPESNDFALPTAVCWNFALPRRSSSKARSPNASEVSQMQVLTDHRRVTTSYAANQTPSGGRQPANPPSIDGQAMSRHSTIVPLVRPEPVLTDVRRQ